MTDTQAFVEFSSRSAAELAEKYAELWTEDGRHILQPPQEIREIAARPGIAMTAILEARGYEEIEARATSAYEHWVGSEERSHGHRRRTHHGRPGAARDLARGLHERRRILPREQPAQEATRGNALQVTTSRLSPPHLKALIRTLLRCPAPRPPGALPPYPSTAAGP